MHVGIRTHRELVRARYSTPLPIRSAAPVSALNVWWVSGPAKGAMTVGKGTSDRLPLFYAFLDGCGVPV